MEVNQQLSDAVIIISDLKCYLVFILALKQKAIKLYVILSMMPRTDDLYNVSIK